MLPGKYQPLFAALIKDISLNDLMDNRDHVRAYDIMAKAMVSEKEGPWCSHKGECLLHSIRKTFYDTLLIIHNDYNPYKYDYVIVTLSREIISERRWEKYCGNTGTSYTRDHANGHVVIGNFQRMEAP
jgi:hypothetical protein